MEILGAATVRAPLFYHTSFLLSSLFIKKIKKWSRFSKSAPTGKEVRIIPYDWNRWESNPRSSHCIGLTSPRCGFTYSIPFLFFIITFLFYFVKGFFKPLHKIIRQCSQQNQNLNLNLNLNLTLLIHPFPLLCIYYNIPFRVCQEVFYIFF